MLHSVNTLKVASTGFPDKLDVETEMRARAGDGEGKQETNKIPQKTEEYIMTSRSGEKLQLLSTVVFILCPTYSAAFYS